MATFSKYYTDVEPRLNEILSWRKEGHTMKWIADELGINAGTISVYRKKHPAFNEVLERGELRVLTNIENSLYRRAQGYEYKEVRSIYKKGELDREEVFNRHMPADPKAAAIALSTLARDKYKVLEIAKIEIEKQKLEILKQKSLNEVDLDTINENINNLAALLNNPSKPRRVK